MPDLIHGFVKEPAQAFPADRHSLQQQKPQQDAVPFRDVSFDAQAARFLASHEDILRQHQFADVFKADGGLKQRQIVFPGQKVHHAGCGDGLDHAATQMFVLDKVPQDDGKDAVGREKITVLVDRPDPVGITVQSQPYPVFAAPEE